jgi:hypothetical protein
VDARDQGPARSTYDDAKELATGTGGVRDLEYGELAVALSASGVHPKHFRSAEPAQLMAWAAQGLAQLGIERVRHYTARTQRINFHVSYNYNPPADQAEYARMWPCSYRRVQSCHDAAWRLAFPLPGGAL